jgi:hypothetical protein
MFTPIHNFSGCRNLRNEIQKLKEKDAIPQSILKLHQTYHYALFHKLKGAKFHLEDLQELLEADPQENMVSLGGIEEFLYKVNHDIDGFFYNIGSAMDILSREILSYFTIPLPRTVYFRTARELIASIRPSDPILSKLADPPWREEFTLYRNTITHEVLVEENCIQEISPDGGEQKEKIIVQLPNAPRGAVDERFYGKNPDALAYCTEIFKNVILLIDEIYTSIAERIASGEKLPL